MVLQNYQNLIEITSNIFHIIAFGVGFKCPRKIHLNTQCPPTWKRDNPYYHSLQWGVDQRGLLLFARIWHGAVVAQFVCLTQSAVEHFYQKFHWTFAKCLIFLMREYCEEEMWVWVFPNHKCQKCQKILSNHKSETSNLTSLGHEWFGKTHTHISDLTVFTL